MRNAFSALLIASAFGAASVAHAQAPAAPAPGAATPMAPSTSSSAPAVGTVPASGANSFTEAQARSRIEAAGFTNVSELQKDDQGVWRGRADRNGATTQVGVDYQGTVVLGTAPAPAR
nr:hypothetical protein [uncultured Roseococcus sp.]